MGALSNILVVAIEQAVAAPLCTSRLADAGARVIKVERAEGDFARGYDTAAKGESSYFAWLNQGKESVCLDFKQTADAKLLWKMIEKADVLIQNLSPGALERAGFSPDTLLKRNPSLIICNVSGYGERGDLAQKRAYDLLVQAESGLISVSGDINTPGRIGVSICDVGAGVSAYAAILEAIIRRSQTGVGESISISLFDVAAEWMTVPYMHAEYGAGAPVPAGLCHPSIAPYGAFECKQEKLVLISVQNEREWQRLCADVLHSDSLLSSALFNSNNQRVKNRPALEQEINAITRKLSANELQQRLQNASIAYGAINSAADLSSHPALRKKSALTADGQSMSLPAHPVVRTTSISKSLSDDLHGMEAQSEQDTNNAKPTPSVGQHTAAIRAEFNVTDDNKSA